MAGTKGMKQATSLDERQEKARQRVRRWWAKQTPIRRSSLVRKANLAKYGITLEEYKWLFDAQEGLCAICRKPEPRLRKDGTPMNLCIDHNHETNQVRQLLCSLCNVMLGATGDNKTVLARAIEYLSFYEGA